MMNEDVGVRRYKVHIQGISLSGSFSGFLVVRASDADDATERAYHHLLNLRTWGRSNWSRSMFRVLAVDKV